MKIVAKEPFIRVGVISVANISDPNNLIILKINVSMAAAFIELPAYRWKMAVRKVVMRYIVVEGERSRLTQTVRSPCRKWRM